MPIPMPCQPNGSGSNKTMCVEGEKLPDFTAGSKGTYAAGSIYADSGCNTSIIASIAVQVDACVNLRDAGFPVYGGF